MSSIFYHLGFCVSILASEQKAMAAINAAMQEWELKTCIRFKKRTTERNYVQFFKGSG